MVAGPLGLHIQIHKYSRELAPEHAVYAFKYSMNSQAIGQQQKQLLSSFEFSSLCI